MKVVRFLVLLQVRSWVLLLLTLPTSCLVNKDKDMPNYNTQGITSSAGSDPRNLGGSEGYGNPTASTSSGIMSSTANPTANDDNKDEPSFFESIANLFSGAGADLPSDKSDDDGDSGISFYDNPMFTPYDGGSDNDITPQGGLPFETTAADRALYEALGVEVPEVYKGKMPEEEPEPNLDMDVLQKALQPDPITVEELEVKAGDTLTAIAEEKGLPVQAVIDANPQIKNPDLIRPGEVVSLPAAQAEIGQARASIMPAQQEIGQARAAIIMKGIDKLFGMFPPKTKEEKAAKSELEYFLDAQPDSALPDFFKYVPDAVQVQEYLKGRADRKKAAGENVTLPGTVSDMGKLLKTATDPEAPAPVSEDPDREFYQSGVPIEERVFEGGDPRNLGGAEGYGSVGTPADAEAGEGLMSKPYDSKAMEDINNPLGRRNTIVSGFDKNITSNGSFSNTEMTKAIKNTTDSNLFNAVVIGNIAKETGGDGPIDELGYGRLTGAEAAKDSRTRGGTDAESIARRVAYRALDSNPDFVNGDRATKDKMIFDIFYDDQYRPAGLKLGNTQPEDGSKFKGRGLIQVTGRENYQKVQDKLEAAGINVDLMANPELINDDKYALPAALAFLEVKGVTKDNADQLGPYKVSRLINAGEGDTEATSRWSQITRVLTGGDLSSANSSDEKAAQTKAGITGTYSNGRSKVDGNIGPASERAFRRYLVGQGVTIPDNATAYDLVRLVNTN
jgi:predicted chitinase/LysM repeat protein